MITHVIIFMYWIYTVKKKGKCRVLATALNEGADKI